MAQSVAHSPHSKKVVGSIPAGDAVGVGGVSSLRVISAHTLRWGWRKGLSVWSLHVLPVFPWVASVSCYPHKNMQRSLGLYSLPLASRGARWGGVDLAGIT